MKTYASALKTFQGILTSVILLFPVILAAQETWPKEITTATSTVIMYQPQPDSMIGDHLYSRAAISITPASGTTPMFGAVWTDSRFNTDRVTGLCSVFDVNILNLRFPGIDTLPQGKVERFTKMLEDEATSWNMEFSLDELKSTLALNQASARKSADFNNKPPEIIYSKQNSVLVSFDGDPSFREIENAGLKRAVNTPFLVLYDKQERNYYLNGSGYWYRSADPVKSAWTNVRKPSSVVAAYFGELQKQNDNTDLSSPNTDKNKSDRVANIIVRTRPAELIQTQGDPKYAPIQGTQLLYVTNTDDNIFMTIDDNQYYVLISGRWYRSAALAGPWSFIDSDNLPGDFARIPEGSEKDVVLASIAGTDAAKDAVMDAQIPQTAAVDRKSAKCDVQYDGDPKFERIRGTELARGMNTASTVLLYNNTYYVCDNAVWFIGYSPTGPWQVATALPDEIQNIPPDDPSYNVKYVYIYDVQPDVVYIGYTPGYTGSYVYGPTVVYGTGWYYHPFYGTYYYPRPRTYGFCMNYNPWFGWSMGYSMSYGWFHYGYGPGWHHGGWWGPPMYRPPYHPPYDHYYGARQPEYRGGRNAVNINNSRTNIYNQRSDGSAHPVRPTAGNTRPGARPVTPGDNTRPGTRPTGTNENIRPGTRTDGVKPSPRPGTQPGAQPATRDAKPADRTGENRNNVYTDKKGDVYRKDNGNWQQHNGRTWETAQPVQQERTAKPPVKVEERAPQPKPQERSGFNRQEMERQSQARERGTQNTNNRTNVQRTAPAAQPVSRPAGGSAKPSGGKEGRRR